MTYIGNRTLTYFGKRTTCMALGFVRQRSTLATASLEEDKMAANASARQHLCQVKHVAFYLSVKLSGIDAPGRHVIF